ncbi:phasin family protein [Rubrivirga sp. IMCC43871]|uniref:phasin family protein n=1 Tax=Rubrivirga sp. IMCC43871 TaxID=3391575 RepID=UPI00398FAF60
MATSKPNKSKKLPKSLRKGSLPSSVADVLAAGLGALEKAQQTGSESFDALVSMGTKVVEKGSDAARGASSQVEKAASAVTHTAKGVAGGAAQTVTGSIEAVVETALGKLGVPGRDEVLALQAQVEALEARIASLAATGSSAASERSVYEVSPHEQGWSVTRVGAGRASAVHGTKKEAVRDARQTAKAHAPSTLRVFKTDGEVSESVDYDAD